ncbi:MAG: DUF2344 domain-containing protein [Anaerolineae bacterium]|nr:DUF2344 domain-containing protein [Anaerolineae bacterium]
MGTSTWRVWERVLRRRVPVAYTKGFNPQLRIQFASALPVGCRGRAAGRFVAE